MDDALYSAFGQRIVSTIFTETNQYRVILEANPRLLSTPDALKLLHLPTSAGVATPLNVTLTLRVDLPESACSEGAARSGRREIGAHHERVRIDRDDDDGAGATAGRQGLHGDGNDGLTGTYEEADQGCSNYLRDWDQ